MYLSCELFLLKTAAKLLKICFMAKILKYYSINLNSFYVKKNKNAACYPQFATLSLQ